MDVAYRQQGIHLPALDLWLDPGEGTFATAFLSHAHADHLGATLARVFCTPVTSELFALRGGERTERRAVGWGEPFEHAGARLTLFPAGHILGAAQLLVEHAGERLVYTGDLKLEPPMLADAAAIVPCDHLVIESTFGLPIFRFLSADAARDRLVAHARTTLEAGNIPIFLGYPLGRGQEIVDALSEAGVPVSLHGALAKYVEIYRRHTGRRLAFEPYERGAIAGHAVVGPTAFGRQLAAAVPKSRVAAVSGWALLDNARARYGADTLVPYSDHASFPELLRYVEGSGARRIDVVHGHAEPFAAILRSRGFDARAPRDAAAPVDAEEAAV